MGELFERYDAEPMNGKDITICDHFPAVFISESDEVYCYPGICLNDDNHRNKAGFMHPYYMIGKHSTDSSISDEITGFYRIADGCIVLDDYIDCRLRSKQLFKKINTGIKFSLPGSYYAVFVDQEEDEELTRAIFGLTYGELTILLDAYAKVMGTCRDFYTYPRLTRSVNKENFCDLTELWIPKQFPYVTFSENGFDFSHVSMWGLYRHLQLLTGCKINSMFSQVLLKNGATVEVFNNLFNIGKTVFYQTKVTKTVRIGTLD